MILLFSSILLIVTIGLVIGIFWIFTTLLVTRVPFVKTPMMSIRTLLRRFEFSAGETIIDLGCGDASVLIAIQRLTGAKAIGYEISPLAYLLAKYRIWQARAKVKVLFQDFRKADIREATVIFCFCIVGIMPQMSEYLKTHANKKARIISYGYILPSLRLIDTIRVFQPDGTERKFYCYRIP